MIFLFFHQIEYFIIDKEQNMSRSGISDGGSATSSSNEELHELHKDGITIVNPDGKETVLDAVTYTTNGPTHSSTSERDSFGRGGNSGNSDGGSPTSSSNDRDDDNDRSIGNSVSLDDLDRRFESLSDRGGMSGGNSNDNEADYSRESNSQMNYRGF